MAKSRLQPVHPGEVLTEKFLKPMSLSQNRLAAAVGVSPQLESDEIARTKEGSQYTDHGRASWPKVFPALLRNSGSVCKWTDLDLGCQLNWSIGL